MFLKVESFNGNSHFWRLPTLQVLDLLTPQAEQSSVLSAIDAFVLLSFQTQKGNGAYLRREMC